MNDKTCPKFAKCPIFLENVFHNESTGKTYRLLYCERGPKNYQQCRRYQVSEKTGKTVPVDIMPNDRLSIDEIITKYF